MVPTQRGSKSPSEVRPLVEVAQDFKSKKSLYDSTTTSQRESSVCTGRGKLRFAVRQQMMARRREQSDASRGIYKCIFSLSERSAKSKSAVPKAKENTAKVNIHSALYNCLNPKSHSPSALCFQKFITTLILVDVIFYIASTEPKFSGLPLFYYAEGITSTIFLVEYVGRLMVCTEQVSLSFSLPFFYN